MSSASGRPPVVPPPVRNDSTTAVWWILGIVAGGIAVMVCLGLMFAGLVVRNSHVADQGKNVDIQTPVGEIKVNQNPNRASGLPVYPGSTPSSQDSHANVEVSSGEAGVGVAVENYLTADSLDKVTAWYAQRLGSSFTRETKGNDIKVHGMSVTTDADMTFSDDHGDSTRTVVLTQKDDKVEITLVRAGKREAQ
jgi:hypothetical protein